MDPQNNDSSVPEFLLPLLQRLESDPRPVVLMTCGIAGAGKSTLSKTVVKALPNFARLSIDEYIHSQHGLYATDYPASRYSEYQAEARAALRSQLIAILKAKSDANAILDFASAFKDDRDAWKCVVKEHGGRWVLVYLEADRETLWRRIQERKAKEINADSAFDMTEEILDGYLKGFEVPSGEGEVVLKVV